MNWKEIYSGIVLEDGLKTDGMVYINALWTSVVIFPNNKEAKIELLTYSNIVNAIVKAVSGRETQERNEVYTSAFKVSLEIIVTVVEKEIDKTLDRYEGIYEGAKKELAELMQISYFDGGVVLFGRVAVWNDDVDG